MQELVIGIDLGTTFSLAAVLEGGEPRILLNAEGEVLTPSVVGLDDAGAILVGAAAAARRTTHPGATASNFKRAMGTEEVFSLEGRKFLPEELSAVVLRKLKEDVESQLGREIHEAVVTVPAYFGELQRRATRDACEIAGLPVSRIINEPTAAALAFGLHQLDQEMRVVVLDLGGGTFDVTVLEIVEGVIEIQATAGDARLGGEDFTEALAGLLRKRLLAGWGEQEREGVAQARLLAAAERCKRQLQEQDSYNVVLTELELQSGRVVQFETVVAEVDARDVWTEVLKRIEGPIRRALHDGGVRPEEIDQVLLVGGSTRLKCFRQRMGELFGKVPRRALPPDEAVALGASIQAALKFGDRAVEDLVVTDIAPFSLGVETCHQMGGRLLQGIFTPIIERGTVLPASREEQLTTIDKSQTALRVRVYQGEYAQCSRNQKLGEYVVKGIPRAEAGEQILTVRYTYDLNGILEVDVTVNATGVTSSLVIERSPGRMTPEQVADARRAMQKLKFHPRDSLPNQVTLHRANALFAELKGAAREELGAAIAEFRMVLEQQEASAIEERRSRLNQLLVQWR